MDRSMHAGNVSAQGTKVSQVTCEVTSKALSKIESQDGFANARAPPKAQPAPIQVHMCLAVHSYIVETPSCTCAA